ncbi:hypothetical protein Ddye_007909 [Dipteronia dyeriana]|uniref:MULE transposase domain-containing protein n=1 Tax=Dipteronia dyeriana TaxID=168575 RepID=A0AAE0CS44_9ROSI|nr:hypothetical protein Ddye_007909 [Dipteronia dyeriana]
MVPRGTLPSPSVKHHLTRMVPQDSSPGWYLRMPLQQTCTSRFSIDDKDMLANIFWMDSHSRFEYQCLRDVLIFDSTYKTNAYAKPLVLFVGVNNHHMNYVFGIALLSDKTMQSYRWAINTLINFMGHKHPISMLTDRDKAM